MTDASDIRLLEIEMGLLWGEDIFGRALRPHPLLAVAISASSHEMRISPPSADDPPIKGDPEEVLKRIRESRFPENQQDFVAWPSFVFSKGVRYATETANFEILTSVSPALATNNDVACPEPWWEAEEWSDLLAGRLGPWALGILEGRVVSVCHTPVASSIAAEAGIWTHPDERGKGWASAVADAWAEVAEQTFDVLFYSTSFDNVASQAVARRLRLRPIGAIWQLPSP